MRTNGAGLKLAGDPDEGEVCEFFAVVEDRGDVVHGEIRETRLFGDPEVRLGMLVSRSWRVDDLAHHAWLQMIDSKRSRFSICLTAWGITDCTGCHALRGPSPIYRLKTIAGCGSCLASGTSGVRWGPSDFLMATQR